MKKLSLKEIDAIINSDDIKVIKSILLELIETVKDLTLENIQLKAEIENLRGQISKNSRNSSKPPSTDGLKQIPQSTRKNSKLKPGAQKGHQGYTLQKTNNPDYIKKYTVEECENCKSSLKNKKSDTIESRQVFDVPPAKLEVTEHQVEVKQCPHCKHINKAEFPKDVTAPVQYGQRVKAMVIYLKGYQLLSLERTTELFEDLFGFSLSEGTLNNIIKKASYKLNDTLEQIKDQIKRSKIAHFDETGISVMKKRSWLHTASTEKLTYYEVHDKRGSEAMDDIGILPEFRGRSIHDFWKAYWIYEKCKHGLCNAHHLRELIFLHEEQEQSWAKNMIDCLLQIKESVDYARETTDHLEPKQIETFKSIYEAIIAEGYEDNPLKVKDCNIRKPGRVKKSKSRNLLERLDECWEEVLAFMYDFNVPFDNNLAERDIRMVKVQQKISGTFRSKDGSKAFCRIRSYISTVKKNCLSVIDSIEGIFNGKFAEIF